MNYNHLGFIPNQTIQGDPTECVALSVAGIIGNVLLQPIDPDFTYAMTLKIMGVKPNTGGLDPLSAMQSAVVNGVLPASAETFTALTMGELYIANWQNYTASQRVIASQKPQKGIKGLFSYQDITNYLDTYQCGVNLTLKWFQDSFNIPNSDGTLPSPRGLNTIHSVIVYGHDEKGLLIEPHLGAGYGLGGYCYFSETIFGLIYQSAYGFDFNAWRWLSLARIAVSKPWTIPDILPLLSS